MEFLSTPSARRATTGDRPYSGYREHFYPRPPRGGRRQLAALILPQQTDFYPRPPRGGRHADRDIAKEMLKFLSTPSARRATPVSHKRVEGCQVFLSTPSARRATFQKVWCIVEKAISIHALREEGDRLGLLRRYKMDISIHALREEGDSPSTPRRWNSWNFYPRPPRGGRPISAMQSGSAASISIHALREEGDRTRRRSSDCL